MPNRALKARPAQYSNSPDLSFNAGTLAEFAKIAKARVSMAAAFAYDQAVYRGDDNPAEAEDVRLIGEIRDRKSMLEPEQARLRAMFRRWDNLYYPQTVTTGGPDHWPEEEKPGRVHISDNTPPLYVDIPAGLEAYEPVENYVAESSEKVDRDKAARAERLYFKWKDESEFELTNSKACIVKELYGFTYGKVYWDSIAEYPRVSLIDSPENLYVGWGASDFSRMDWTIYCYGLSPQSAQEMYGVSVTAVKEDGAYYPMVTSTGDHADPIGSVFRRPEQESARFRSEYEQMQVEVYDYWYRKPGKAKKGKASKPEIWNAIYVGNYLVSNAHHPEYDELPYVPLPNTYIPGSPYGRSAFHDLEQMFREKDERITNAAQMIASITEGQRWQIVGSEAPDDVPVNAIPKPNKVAAPGPNAEIKAIQPFVPEYAVKDYIEMINAEMEDISGLNELLRGRAPATILGSSKAIAALVANYEARISMRRQLLYQWRKRVWAMAAKIWEAKDSKVAAIIDGQYRIEVSAPELTPRDELENAQKALNLVQNRVWSMRRAMNATGVEDPEDELNLIREEQTDAALNPAAVQTQVTLLGALQAQGIQPPQAAVNQAQNAARSLNPPPAGGQSLNAPENQANPPGQNVPTNAQAPNGAKALNQSLIQGGEASGRIITQTPIAGGGG